MQTSSEGRHSIRISGLSTIDFRAGFSRIPTMDFKTTSSRPVQGVQSVPVWIKPSSLLFTPGWINKYSFPFSRCSHSHPSEHHWTVAACSTRSVRTPRDHRGGHQNVADPVLPRASAVQPLEHHRVHPAQRGFLSAGYRIWPGWLCIPESLQCFFLQYYTKWVMCIVAHNKNACLFGIC